MNRELYWNKNKTDGDWELIESNGEHEWPLRAYIRRNKEGVSIKVRTWTNTSTVQQAWLTVARLPPNTSTPAARNMAMNYCLLGFDTGV